MKPVNFSIVILTYNRPELLKHTLQSLAAQTNKAFHVRVVDNGSTPAIDHQSLPQLPDLELIRLDSNQHPSDVMEQYWHSVPGTHFLWLGDDDALHPDALTYVAKFFQDTPCAEYVSSGFAHFDHDARCASLNSIKYSGKVSEYDARALALGYCSAWNLNVEGTRPPRSHSSTTFIDRRLLEKAAVIQGRLFILPFSDVGLLGALACTSKAYYFNLPLGVIGHSSARVMAGAARGSRHALVRYAGQIRYSPVKEPSFVNLGVESHLNIALRHGLITKDKVFCRPDFFRAHLAQILTDAPLDTTTLNDLYEAVKPALTSLQAYPSKRWKQWRRNLNLKLSLKLISLAKAIQKPSQSLKSTQSALLNIAGWLVGSTRMSNDLRPSLADSTEKFKNIAEYAQSIKLIPN